jgi:hypothetical protein
VEIYEILMEEDLIASLTRQVKEEVIENYLFERRVMELQIEHLNGQAVETLRQARLTGLQLARLSDLMIGSDMQARLRQALGIAECGFWVAPLDVKFKRNVRVRGLTRRIRFRKIVFETYVRSYEWMKRYRDAWEEFANECSAVNRNIDSFHRNFDILSIVNFIRNLDVGQIQMKQVLGNNFTAREMSELDKSLYINPVSAEKLGVPPPLDLPDTGSVLGKLCALAEEVFAKYPDGVKKILK